jgi:hypothetical protein
MKYCREKEKIRKNGRQTTIDDSYVYHLQLLSIMLKKRSHTQKNAYCYSIYIKFKSRLIWANKRIVVTLGNND